MALVKQGTFSTLFASMADKPNLTSAEMKAAFDSQGAALKTTLNNLITALEAVTDGASGADQIGMTVITETGSANKVQTVIEALITRLKAVTDSAAGADLIGMTAITETGANATVQSIIEALITRIKATTDSASGADLVGATAIADWTGATVQAILESAKTYVDAHKADYTMQVPYGGATTNVGNAYSVASPAIAALAAGMAISVKINADATGAATLNWNGKGAVAIKKHNGADFTNLKNGGIYTLRYDGTNFIVQGSDAAGDATAANLLSGKTATVDSGEITGTMPNNAGDNASLSSAVDGTKLKLVAPEGYFDGSDDTVTITDADFAAANIKSGVNVLGIAGTHGLSSVQSGVTSAGATSVTVTSVDTSKSILFVNARALPDTMFRASLANSTTINFGFDSGSPVFSWFLVEFAGGVSVQRGTGVMNAATATVDIDITAVDTADSFILADGYASDGTTQTEASLTTEFVDTDTIRLTRTASSYNCAYSWQVVTFV